MGVVGGPLALQSLLAPVGPKDIVQLEFLGDSGLAITCTSQTARYQTRISLDEPVENPVSVCVNGKDFQNAIACCEAAPKLSLDYDEVEAVLLLTAAEEDAMDLSCAIRSVVAEPRWMALGSDITKIRIDTEILHISFLQCFDSQAGSVTISLDQSGMKLETSWQNDSEASVVVPANLIELEGSLGPAGLKAIVPQKDVGPLCAFLGAVGGTGGLRTELTFCEVGVRFVRKLVSGHDSSLEILTIAE